MKLGLAVVVGGAPFGGNPAFLLEPNQGSVNRALIEKDGVAADLFNAAGDTVAVQRPIAASVCKTIKSSVPRNKSSFSSGITRRTPMSALASHTQAGSHVPVVCP